MPRQHARLRHAVLVAVAACCLAGCSSKPATEAAPAASASTPPSPAPATTPATPAPPAASAAPAAKPRLHMQLRSTPPGAEAAVDGRPAGRTPTVADLDDDGREHEFTFVLPGYSLERYRTRPVQSGVVHAPMRLLPTDAAP